MSYHLRQLEKQGFVREVTGKGTGRERWWERVPVGISIASKTMRESPSARAVGDIIAREWSRSRESHLRDFEEHGLDRLSPEWMDASTVSSFNVRMSAEELDALSREMESFIESRIRSYRGRTAAGIRPVQVHFNAFPILEGDESPAAPETHDTTENPENPETTGE
jgi:DNA-binding MarR family transcriptional regulator